MIITESGYDVSFVDALQVVKDSLMASLCSHEKWKEFVLPHFMNLLRLCDMQHKTLHLTVTQLNY